MKPRDEIISKIRKKLKFHDGVLRAELKVS
jgi:hypothetical protein